MALRTNDRVLVLEKIDPKNKDVGLVDPQVFEGKNNLHLVMDPSTCMWTFKYERGAVPPNLRATFTSFKRAKDHAEIYLATKNIKIVDVKD
jgi:hypothetical protein